MLLHVRQATLADLDQLLEVFFSAFDGEPVSMATLPRPSGSGRAFQKQFFEQELQNPKTNLIVAESAETGEIISLAKWNHPGSGIHDPPPAAVWPQDGNPELAVRFFGTFADGHRKTMGDRRHWYLELLLTKRSGSGKGAGRALMEWGLQRADEDGVETYLESTAEAEGMYQGKFGFKPVKKDTFELNDGSGLAVNTTLMVRPAKKVEA